MPVSRDPEKQARQLANLRPAPAAPAGHSRSLVRGGRAEVLFRDVPDEVRGVARRARRARSGVNKRVARFFTEAETGSYGAARGFVRQPLCKAEAPRLRGAVAWTPP